MKFLGGVLRVFIFARLASSGGVSEDWPWQGSYVITDYCWDCGGCAKEVIITPSRMTQEPHRYFVFVKGDVTSREPDPNIVDENLDIDIDNAIVSDDEIIWSARVGGGWALKKTGNKMEFWVFHNLWGVKDLCNSTLARIDCDDARSCDCTESKCPGWGWDNEQRKCLFDIHSSIDRADMARCQDTIYCRDDPSWRSDIGGCSAFVKEQYQTYCTQKTGFDGRSAQQACPQSCNSCDCGNCSVPRFESGCNNIPVEQCVCDIDSYCCTDKFDTTCSQIATNSCNCVPHEHRLPKRDEIGDQTEEEEFFVIEETFELGSEENVNFEETFSSSEEQQTTGSSVEVHVVVVESSFDEEKTSEEITFDENTPQQEEVVIY